MDQAYAAGRMKQCIADAKALLDAATEQCNDAAIDDRQLHEARVNAQTAARLLTQADVWRDVAQAVRTR